MNEIAKAPLLGEILSKHPDVRAVGLTHPLRGKRIDITLPAGVSIREVLDQALDIMPGSRLAPHLRVHVDGVPVPPEWWSRVRLKAGSTVTFRPVPSGSGVLKTVLLLAVVVAAFMIAGPLGGALGLTGTALTVGTALISSGIILAGSLAVNALFPIRPPATGDGGQFQQLASIQGANNQANAFGPVPVFLGQHRMSPFYGAKPYTEILGDDQFLRLLFVWGYGPIRIDTPEAVAPFVSSLRIGETPLSNYLDFEIEHRFGLPGDAPISLYPAQVDEQVLAITLTDSQDQPGGSSGMQDANVDYQVQLTPVDIDQISIDVTAPDGIYQIETDTGNAGGLAISVQARYRLVGTTDWTFFPPGSDPVGPSLTFFRSLKTARLGSLVSVPRGQYEVAVRRISGHYNLDRVKEKIVWTALRAFKNTNPVAFSKPVAMTALRIKATDQLNGVVDTFNGICGSLVTAYSGSGGIWNATTLSQNPADLFRWVLQSPANARPVPDAQIDLDNLQEWWLYCVANGFKFNQVRTARSSVQDALLDIAAAGRAVPTFIDGKWGAIWDRPDDTIVQHFTPRNSWDFSGAKPYARLPDGFRVQFINEVNGYTDDERIVYDDGFDATNATLFEAIQFPGVTDPDLIWKHGRFHIAQARLRPEEDTLNTGWENLVCTRGDRVRVTHDVLLIGQVSGRVKAVAGQVVTLDELVTIDIAKTWGVRFRIADPDNTSFVRAVDLTGVFSGETNQVTLAGDLSAVAVGTLFAFGKTDQESAVYRVKTIVPQKDLGAQLILVDDAPEISQADQGPIPAYDPHVTIPPDPLTLPPQHLQFQEVYDGVGAAVRALVRLTWQVPRFGNIASFEVQSIDHTGGGDWTRVATVPVPTTFCDVPLVAPGSWGFRVRCLFANGTVSAFTTVDPLLLLGLLEPPADVQNFRWSYVSGRSELDWDPVIDARGIFYEMRKGASWDAALVVADALAQPRFQTVGDEIYWVAAYVLAPFGTRIYSVTKQSLTLTNSVLTDNVVVSHNERAEGWTGSITGSLGIDQQQNFLRSGGADNILVNPSVLGTGDVLNAGGQGGGTYISKFVVNVGKLSRCRVSVDYTATAVSALADFLAEPSILDDPDILQAYLTQFIRVYPIIRTAQSSTSNILAIDNMLTLGDLLNAGVQWGAWQKWSPDVYTGTLFQLGLLVDILDSTANAIAYVLNFAWTIDVEDRFDRYQNLTIPPGGATITFEPGGYNGTPTGHAAAFIGGPNNAIVPHIVSDILNAPTLRVAVTSVTLSSCFVRVLNSSTSADVGGSGVNVFAQGF